MTNVRVLLIVCDLLTKSLDLTVQLTDVFVSAGNLLLVNCHLLCQLRYLNLVPFLRHTQPDTNKTNSAVLYNRSLAQYRAALTIKLRLYDKNQTN